MTARPILAFDLDGTLVDSVGDLATGLSCALVDRGVLPEGTRLPAAVVRPWIGEGARNLCARALSSLSPARAGSDEVDALLARFRARYGEHLVEETRPFPGVPEALAALRDDGVVLAVATNKPGAFARPIVETLLPGLFSAVTGPDDAGALKPDPAMLARIERTLDGRVAALVGDSAVDAATAAAHGTPFVLVGWGLGDAATIRGERHRVSTGTDLLAAARACIEDARG